MRSKILLVQIILVVSLFNILAGITFAEWPSDLTVNVPICTAANDQSSPQLVSDGAGGAIITWVDYRSGSYGSYDIYAQRVNGSGAMLWTKDGVPICTAASSQEYSKLVSDGAGGAIITWEDGRSGAYDIYAQRVDASGAVLWAKDGVPICRAASSQEYPQLVSDGAGGAIIMWDDCRSGDYDIYAQRVDASGAVLWTTNGVPICTAAGYQMSSQLVSDGAGGAIITWWDKCSGDYDIYAQRVDAIGAVLWAKDGVPICRAASSQEYPQLVSDGAGGAIITWWDNRSGTYDIYAQRVDAIGAVLWTTNGVPIYEGYGGYPQLVSDGAGGAIITWGFGVQRVNANGTVLWTKDGVRISGGVERLISDGAGGAITITSHGNVDIYAQRVNGSGAVLWATNGVPICTAAGYQVHLQLVNDDAGGAIITWEDWRSGSRYYADIYAQNVNSDGTIGSGQYDAEPIQLIENGWIYTDYLNAGYYQKYKFAVTADGRQYTITATPTNGDVDLYYRNFDPNISPFVPGSYDASSRHPGACVEQLSFIAPSDGKNYTVYPAVLAVTNSHYTISVTSSAPGGLTLQSPADGSHITASPTFKWSQAPNAIYYELVLAKDANFTQPIWNRPAIGGSETSVVYSGSAVLEASQTYYWRMRFQDVNQVWSDWTDAFSFVKDAPAEQLPVPILSAPADGANVALPERFSWQAVPDAVRYIVQVAEVSPSPGLSRQGRGERDADFANVLWSGQSSTNAIAVPSISGLTVGNAYHWRVAGIDSGGNIGNYSESYSFTLVETTSPPARPTPISPANGATIEAQKITFSWTSSPTATAYNLRYSIDPTFPKSSAKTWTISDITATSHTVTLPLASATTIYWQVSAKNAGGDSGWTDAISFNYAPPVTSKVTSVKIDMPKDGQRFIKGSSLGAHAYMTGTYEGKIAGAWYLDGEHHADFTANMTPAKGAEISITGLPTSEIKPRTIQVRLISPNEISSNAVTYYIVDIQPGTPAKLRLTADPTAIEANGASTSTITAEVLDGYGYLVSGDNDREIAFSVSGEGILSSPTALTQNGKATVTLQSTTTPDEDVTVTASATSLTSASVIVQTYTSSVEPYLSWIRSDANQLKEIGYDISGVNRFLSTQIEVPNPTPEAIESLKRLELMMSLLVEAYYGTSGDLTGGTKILLDDFSENIGSVVALIVTYPFVIKGLLVKIAHEALPRFLVESIENLAKSGATKCVDFGADFARNVVDLVGSGPIAYAAQELIDIATLTTNEFITKMTGELDPVEASKLLIEKIFQAVGPMLAKEIYVYYTQPVLNQAVSLAESHTYGGTYESCKNSVTFALVGIRTESGPIHNDVVSNSKKMQTLSIIQKLLMTGMRGKMSIIDFAKDTIAAIFSFLDLKKWYYSINSSTEALIVVRRISNEHIPNSISGVFGVEVASVRAAPPLARKIPDAMFYRSLMLRMEASAGNYDSVVREILFALENDDLNSVLERIEILLNADAQLSSDMAIVSAPIGAAATNALKTIPDFDEIYNASSFVRSDAMAQQTLFLNALMNYLIDAEDDALRQTAIDRGYAALQANITASDEISQTVTGLFTTPAYPYLLVTSVELSADELKLHDIFTITAKIMNAGAGMAHNVKIELSSDESVELLSVAIIDIGDLDNGSERTVSWELKVVSNTGHVSFVNLNPTSDDAINLVKMIPIYLNETNYGDVSGDGTISALDAAMILQHTVGLITLSEEAQALADVSNNGEISAYDASLILQRVVGLIDKFPIEEGTTASPSQYGQPYCISLANAQAKPAEHVIIPLTFGGADVLCGEFTVEFDADVLEFEKPSFSQKLGFLYIGNKINFAFASAEPNKPQSSNVIDLEFAVLRNAAIDETKLRITAAKINESMNVSAINGVVNILPLHTALLQNYPNPFNPETWIPYQLADAADVTLEIYGITGNLIKSINLGRKAAGAYMTKEKAICWDGRNEVGEIVASGVYFYTLRAGEFRATRRMVIVK